MEIRLLGPLEAMEDGVPLPLGGGKQRALLAVLSLAAGQVVAARCLVEDLWGFDPPDTAPKMVQIHVSALRKVLPPGSLVTRAPGYLLDLPVAAVDVLRAEDALGMARAAATGGDPARAGALLREALGMWRGTALSQFPEPFAVYEGRRLEELRLAMTEERIAADLAMGGGGEVVAELEALVAAHPLREGLRGQLMVALYRAGRQGLGLAAYSDARRTLSDELGIDPSTRLRDLERAVLQQDPRLDPAPPPIPARASMVPPQPRPAPAVRYACSGDLSIAYEVTGRGPLDLVLVPGFLSHLEQDRREPRHLHFLERLAGFGRLIRFDKRGTGLSDRPPEVPDMETRMDDLRAVMDAAGSERALVVGYSEGGPLSVLFAATYPERVAGLVLIGCFAKRVDPDDDYPWAPTAEQRAADTEMLVSENGLEQAMRDMCPSADDAMALWWGERNRAAASPGALRALMAMNSLIDVRDVLGAVQAPTLLLHRTGDGDAKVEESYYMAARIAGARMVELPGADHFVAIDPDQLIDAAAPFIAGIAASPATTAADQAVATAVVAGGAAPLVSVYEGPTRAVRAAIELAGRLGRGVGVHTGPVLRGAGRPDGAAVRLATAAAGHAAPGEALVTMTTRDLVPGAGLTFDDRGELSLGGTDSRRLFAAHA